jgi:hypothetical protein
MSTPTIDHNLPLSLCLNQSIDLPLPGGITRRDPPTWQVESKDPRIARAMLTSTIVPSDASCATQPAPLADHSFVVWHLNIRGQNPGKTTIHLRETTVTPPLKDQYKLTLEVQVLPQTQQSSGLLLAAGRDNKLQIGGQLGWFQTANDASARTYWNFTPDSSGVYELADVIGLAESPLMPGQPTYTWWQLRGVKEGNGIALFERYFSGDLAETVKIAISVSK